jgi:hypothetical protein
MLACDSQTGLAAVVVVQTFESAPTERANFSPSPTRNLKNLRFLELRMYITTLLQRCM